MRYHYTIGTVLRHKGILPVYLLGFFFTLHFVFPVYINSTFLAEFISEASVGVFYSAASAVTLLGVLFITKLVERIGNYKTILYLIFLEALALFALLATEYLPILLFAFVLHFTLSTVVLFNIDIFLESFSEDSATGGIRGAYLVVLNLAWMLAPAVAGFIVASGQFRSIYLTALILLLPSFFILISKLSHFKDRVYHHLKLIPSLKKTWGNADIRNIFLANFVLKMFFAWMVVYVPLYLIKHVGIEIDVLGIIFTVMLGAYVLLEYPLGKIADTKYGEKEILTLGFVIVAVSAAVFSFIDTTSPFIWAGVLFLSRVGAAMVEVMSEGYFFKKIDGKDTDIMSIFRTTVPIAYIIAPLLASAFLAFFDFRYIFLSIGVFVLLGIYFAAEVHDTL